MFRGKGARDIRVDAFQLGAPQPQAAPGASCLSGQWLLEGPKPQQRGAWGPHMVTSEDSRRAHSHECAPAHRWSSDGGQGCSLAPLGPVVLHSATGALTTDTSTHHQIYLY